MKKKKKTYAYLNQELKFITPTASEAAMKASVATAVVYQILKQERICTKQGWHFSDHKLTDEEIEQLPIKCNHHQAEVKDARGCDKEERESQDMRLFDFPRSKEGKVDEFKSFLFAIFQERWMLIDKKVAQLEKAYIREALQEFKK